MATREAHEEDEDCTEENEVDGIEEQVKALGRGYRRHRQPVSVTTAGGDDKLDSLVDPQTQRRANRNVQLFAAFLGLTGDEG